MRRTVDDWLAEATRSADPGAVDRALARASELASACHELRSVLKAAIALGATGRVADLAARTLDHAGPEREIWGFRDVAAARAEHLADRPGALAALLACEQLYRDSRTLGYEWVLLAKGFVDALGDRAGLRRCLEAGLAAARERGNADDLCAIASAWTQEVDREAGGALLGEAEALATNGSASPWTLSNAWSALDDAVAVRRVLDGALARASSTAAAVHVHKAWASHGQVAEALAALDRAAALAATAADWLTIGEAAFDGQLGGERIRHALEHAEPLATDDVARGRIASGYHVWLQDDEAADRVGSRGLAPGALQSAWRSLEGWESSASALFDWIRSRLPDATLLKIANSDYHMDAQKHLGALRDIVRTGLLPRELDWEPHEVLALSRWATGENVDHLERAFCCVVLCLAPQGGDELETNGVILAESCLALGVGASEGAAQLFAWCASSSEEPESAVALLLLLLVCASTTPHDPRLEGLATTLLERDDPPVALLAASALSSMRGELWRDLASRIRTSGPTVAQVLAAFR